VTVNRQTFKVMPRRASRNYNNSFTLLEQIR